MNPVRFGVIGSGWRAEYFFRLAADRPDLFEIPAVAVRRSTEVDRLAAAFGLLASTDAHCVDDIGLDFVVVCTSAEANVSVCDDLVVRGHAVLLETPAGTDEADFARLTELSRSGARIQVAEQYQYQPLLSARLSVIRSGLLGPIVSARVSVAHAYHGVALIRCALGVKGAEFSVSAHAHDSSIVRGPDRAGPPTTDDLVPSREVMATMTLDGRLGVYDWSDDQYFSWVRGLRFTVRGERGELDGETVRFVDSQGAPVEQTLHRVDTGLRGNLEAPGHRGYLLGDRWVYENPFPSTRWSDDEIAVATVLRRMADYVGEGIDFYPVTEGIQDARVAAAIDRSLESVHR